MRLPYYAYSDETNNKKIPVFTGNDTNEIPASAGSDILVEVEGLSKKFCKDLILTRMQCSTILPHEYKALR